MRWMECFVTTTEPSVADQARNRCHDNLRMGKHPMLKLPSTKVAPRTNFQRGFIPTVGVVRPASAGFCRLLTASAGFCGGRREIFTGRRCRSDLQPEEVNRLVPPYTGLYRLSGEARRQICLSSASAQSDGPAVVETMAGGGCKTGAKAVCKSAMCSLIPAWPAYSRLLGGGGPYFEDGRKNLPFPLRHAILWETFPAT